MQEEKKQHADILRLGHFEQNVIVGMKGLSLYAACLPRPMNKKVCAEQDAAV